MAVSTASRRTKRNTENSQTGNEVVHRASRDSIDRATHLTAGQVGNRWVKGISANPGGRIGAGRYKEMRRLAAELSLRATQRLGELIEDSDGRVAAVACNTLIERAFGKAKEHDPSEDKPLVVTDFASLTLEEKKLLLGLVRRTVTVDPAAGAASEAELVGSHTTIEVQAEPQTELAAAEKPETAPNEAPAADSPPRGVGRMRIF